MMDKTSEKERIGEMIDTVMKVARGDYSVQVELSCKNDEFDSLAMGLNMMIEDIRTGEEALKESEEKFRTFMETASDLMNITDKDGKFTYVNDSMARTLGYSKEQLIGMHITQLLSKEALEKNFKPNWHKFTTNGEMSLETTFLTKEGKEICCEIKAIALYDSDGNYIGSRAVHRDITERKRVEEELVRLSDAVSISPDGIAISDMEGKLTYVNEATLKIYGTDDPKDLLRKTSFELIAPEDREKAFAGLKEVMEKGYGKDKEYHVVTKSGSRILTEMSTSLVKSKTGEAIGFVATFRDITERKRVEQRIEHLNRVLQAIRNVNQLIAREKDSGKLIKGICSNLVETRGYYSAWLALLDESGGLVTTTEAGLGKDFLLMVKQLKRGKLTDCARRALMQPGVVLTKDPASNCTGCPLSDKYGGRGR